MLQSHVNSGDSFLSEVVYHRLKFPKGTCLIKTFVFDALFFLVVTGVERERFDFNVGSLVVFGENIRKQLNKHISTGLK